MTAAPLASRAAPAMAPSSMAPSSKAPASNPPSSVACAHCGLPMQACESHEPVFCCAGCEAVWHTLHSCGLEQYYALQRASGERPNRPTATSHGYLDHTQFADRHVQVGADGLSRTELRIDGMKCGACLWLLEALPRVVPGLVRSRVNLGRSIIELEWRADAVPLSKVADRIASLGYDVRPIGTLASREHWRAQDRTWLVQIGVAGAITTNVMAIAFALYGGQ
ncbi:MAG: heavy metal translocating P-type ATPase metal-binding domain-containing protein, partial [Phycisphaerae bacterium]|nr:heavy metal translocating P-type ATPase metal-binding domain-containing protein [Phycisphaerae bacterium]